MYNKHSNIQFGLFILSQISIRVVLSPIHMGTMLTLSHLIQKPTSYDCSSPFGHAIQTSSPESAHFIWGCLGHECDGSLCRAHKRNHLLIQNHVSLRHSTPQYTSRVFQHKFVINNLLLQRACLWRNVNSHIRYISANLTILQLLLHFDRYVYSQIASPFKVLAVPGMQLHWTYHFSYALGLARYQWKQYSSLVNY